MLRKRWIWVAGSLLFLIAVVVVFVNINIFPFYSYKIGSWSIAQMITNKYKLYPKILPGTILDLTQATMEKDSNGTVKAYLGTVKAVMTPDQTRNTLFNKDVFVYIGEATYTNDNNKYLDVFLYDQIDCNTDLDKLPFSNSRVSVGQLSKAILGKKIKVATNWQSPTFKSGGQVAASLKLPLGSKIIICIDGSPI